VPWRGSRFRFGTGLGNLMEGNDCTKILQADSALGARSRCHTIAYPGCQRSTIIL
jgi:hypothetical protein